MGELALGIVDLVTALRFDKSCATFYFPAGTRQFEYFISFFQIHTYHFSEPVVRPVGNLLWAIQGLGFVSSATVKCAIDAKDSFFHPSRSKRINCVWASVKNGPSANGNAALRGGGVDGMFTDVGRRDAPLELGSLKHLRQQEAWETPFEEMCDFHSSGQAAGDPILQ